jgi:hypothetical protein
VIENDAMSVCVFRDDDEGYLAWLAAHPDGFVLNIVGGSNVTGARVQRAGCWTINRQTAQGRSWTKDYEKWCADHAAETITTLVAA